MSLYDIAKAAKTGAQVECPQCGVTFRKASHQQAFCSNSGAGNCKDAFWNSKGSRKGAKAEFVKVPRELLARLIGYWDEDENPIGSPQHCHNVPGQWDGDAKHPKGSPCLECQAYDELRALYRGAP